MPLSMGDRRGRATARSAGVLGPMSGREGKSMRRTLGICFVVCSLLAAPAWAEISYGPVVLDDATVLVAGGFELELRADYADLGDPAFVGGADTRSRVLAGLDYGATDRFEIGLDLPYKSLENGDSVSGLGDLSLAGKYCLVGESDTTPGVALGLDVVLDTGDEDIVGLDNDIDFDIAAIVSKGYGSWVGHLEISYLVVGEDLADDVLAYGIAVEIPAGMNAYTIELAGNDAEDALGDSPLDAYVGVRKTMDLSDIAGFIGFGLSDASPDFSVGVVYRRSFGMM